LRDRAAAVAEAQGKSRDELTSHILANVEEQLDEAVANGRITQAEADEKFANFSERVDELIDHEGLPFRGKHRFDGMPGMEPGTFQRLPNGGFDIVVGTDF
jgi:hypothetical protein